VQVAHVAELVDAADSKSAVRKGVKVRFLSWAPIKIPVTFVAGIFVFYPFILFDKFFSILALQNSYLCR
jgi:hypothetical protein